ncbi:MAG: hypothetical protein IPL61_23360 [Myxococcales bacterium]|nr:hypothetical protein [Myxococcales bacterium]
MSRIARRFAVLARQLCTGAALMGGTLVAAADTTPAPAPALCEINQCVGVPSLLRAALVDRGAATAQAARIQVGADGRASLRAIVTSADDVTRLRASAAASRSTIAVAPIQLRTQLIYQVVVPIAVASPALVSVPPTTTGGGFDYFLEIDSIDGGGDDGGGSGTPPPDDTDGGSSEGGEAEPVCVTVLGIEMCVS